MRVLRVSGVVVRGVAMVRGRSGRDVEKRIMRVRGGMGGGRVAEDIVVSNVVIQMLASGESPVVDLRQEDTSGRKSATSQNSGKTTYCWILLLRTATANGTFVDQPDPAPEAYSTAKCV